MSKANDIEVEPVVGCLSCKYLGIRFEHLNGLRGVDEWRDCRYPLPCHVRPVAVAMVEDAGKYCRVYAPTNPHAKQADASRKG